MKGRPYYKCYPSDLLGGIKRLTRDEVAAYCVVLNLIYDEGGPIPDDGQWIARQIGRDTSTRLWNTLRGKLIEAGKLYLTKDGKLANGKADAVLASDAKEHTGRSEAGKAGAEVKKYRASKPAEPAGIIPPKAPDKPPENIEVDNENNEIDPDLLDAIGQQEAWQSRVSESRRQSDSSDSVPAPRWRELTKRTAGDPEPSHILHAVPKLAAWAKHADRFSDPMGPSAIRRPCVIADFGACKDWHLQEYLLDGDDGLPASVLDASGIRYQPDRPMDWTPLFDWVHRGATRELILAAVTAALAKHRERQSDTPIGGLNFFTKWVETEARLPPKAKAA